jgi:4-hydroxybenzoate polyprenyltransferase
MTAAGATAGKTRVFAEMIKWEHSIFALPFAFMGAILAVPHGWPSWAEIGWITVVMVSARSLAFGLNRAIDKEIDARNPRTADRAMPKGLLSAVELAVFCLVMLGLFVFGVLQLAPITRPLAPIVLAMFLIYSYTKRFTWLCHFWLGASLGLAPVGAWVAITNQMDWRPWVLFAAVTLWVGGFDVIYATQDIEVDRRDGLKSIPARFGIPAALTITRVAHSASFLLLLAAGAALGLGPVYYLGVLVTGALLAYENLIISPDDLSRLDAAFFTMNGVISVVTLAFTLADKVVRG